MGRQLKAVNEEIEKAEQESRLTKALLGAGREAEKRLEQVDKGLDKFIDIWPQLNSKLNPGGKAGEK